MPQRSSPARASLLQPTRCYEAMFSTATRQSWNSPRIPVIASGGFDFSYRIPRLRDWLTFYGDAFTDDQANPWFAWDKAA